MSAKTVSIVTCILGFVLSTFAVTTPFWATGGGYENGVHINAYAGIWMFCIKSPFKATLDCEYYKPTAAGTLLLYVHVPGQVLLLFCCFCIVLGSKQRCTSIVASMLALLAGCCFVGSYVYFAVKINSGESKVDRDFSFHASFYADIVASILSFITSAALIKLAASLSESVSPFPRITVVNENGVPVRRPADVWASSSKNYFSRREAPIIDDRSLAQWPGIPRSYNNTPIHSYSTENLCPSPHPSRSPPRRHRQIYPNSSNVQPNYASGHGISRDSTLYLSDAGRSNDYYDSNTSIERIQHNLNF